MSLGKLEKVQIRNVWATEYNHFTPWLAKDENMALLNEELELDLEVVRQEEFVGPFKVDILAKETTTGHNVIIENQFGKTDHNHLGQIITYASGLEASTVIWISEKFTEEHRAAIDWLNNISTETVGFFGIEIELYKIGDSEPAPMFNIVCKPNNWSKSVKQKSADTQLTDTRLLQQQYWTRLREFIDKQKRSYRMQKPSPQHWTSISVGRTGFFINAIANTRDRCVSVQFVVSGLNALENFRKLRDKYESDSHAKLSHDLEWLEKTGKEHHVNLLLTGSDPSIREEWPGQHAVLNEWIEKFHRYFSEKVKAI